MNIPTATYRLQFCPDLTFDRAREILPYLAELGISHVYASPVFAARHGSTHGYDILDHARINPELGGREKLELLLEKAKTLGLGWVQDIVPNHMAYDSRNRLLMDVLEKGRDSRFFGFFDINWQHPYQNLNGRLLSPFLGQLYGECLDKGEIALGIDADGFFLRYFQYRMPVLISSYPKLLEHCRVVCQRMEADTGGQIAALDALIAQFSSLSARDDDAVQNAKAALWQVYCEIEKARIVIDAALNLANGKTGVPESFDFLDKLLSEQRFRFSFWKAGNDELNYRRFFTLNDLICLSMDKPEVFDHNHGLVLELVASGSIDGLRVDHIDGLYAPLTYLRRLREKAKDAYIVCEKILSPEEELQSSWPVQGTTGYDLLNILNELYIDKTSLRRLDRFYIAFTGTHSEFEALVSAKKRLFMGKHMAGDIDNLAHLLRHILSRNRYGADFTLYGLRRALVEIMAQYPVYRTYSGDIGLSDSDKFYIKKSAEKARRANQELLFEIDVIEKFLLMDIKEKMSGQDPEECRHFTRRFQQFTGALMAKGAEDTAFYIYNRLISLNEVGGHPDRFGVGPEEFHAYVTKRAGLWPASMNSTSTHDSKRGEDTRARINALTELSGEWVEAVRRWSKFNRRAKTRIEAVNAPDRNDEYFIYQTLIGAMPNDGVSDSFRQRMKDNLIKAVREAKIHTAWLAPDTKYEQACLKFMDAILDPSGNNEFLNDFIDFWKKAAYFGVFNSLSQTLIKLCLPGVPDLFQGSELWSFDLVDPDNRRPVDFARRINLLEKIKEIKDTGAMRALLSGPQDGAIKMFITRKALLARKEYRGLFETGAYLPLETQGRFRDNIIAFARRADSMWAVIAAPRFLSKVVEFGRPPLGVDVWEDTSIILPEYAPLNWRDALSSLGSSRTGNLLAGDIFSSLPVTLLINGDVP